MAMEKKSTLSQGDIEWCAERLLAGLRLEEESESGPSEKLHSAIRLYLQARDRIGRENSSPSLWAQVHLSLGTALAKLPRGDSNAKKQAIQALEIAVLTPDGIPDAVAESICADLAVMMLTEEGSQVFGRLLSWAREAHASPQVVRRRILLVREIREKIDRQRSKVAWLSATNVLANLLRDASDAKDHFHAQAIALYREALACLTDSDEPGLWASLQGELGYTLGISHAGERSQNIEEAIEACNQSARVFLEIGEQSEYATAMASLSNAYVRRVLGDRADNIERAIHACNEALQTRKRMHGEPDVNLLVQLADTYMFRLEGSRSDNIEHALAILEPLLESPGPRNDERFMSNLYNQIGRIYKERIEGNDAENVERSLAAHLRAAELTKHRPSSRDALISAMNVGTLYLLREKGDRLENARNGVRFLEEALSALSQKDMAYDWADCINNVGLANMALAEERGPDDSHALRAVECLRSALEVRTIDDFPEWHRTIQYNLGAFHFKHGQWELAWAAYDAALTAGQRLLEAAFTESGRRTEVETGAVAHVHAAYCLLRLGRWREAFETLDRGKTRLLTATLALGDADLDELPSAQREQILVLRRRVRQLEIELRLQNGVEQGGRQITLAQTLREERNKLSELVKAARRDVENFMPGCPAFSDLSAAIPAHAALIAPLLTEQGGAVFVIPAGIKELNAEHVVLLEKATVTALTDVSEANDRESLADVNQIKAAIEGNCVLLWNTLMGPALDRLCSLGVAPGSTLIVMPQARLSLLPLHAAWREVDGRQRHVIADYPVAYMPSAYVMVRCMARAAEPQRAAQSLLAVINPNSDLPYAAREGEAIAPHFADGMATVLRESSATVEAVEKSCSHHAYLHFACHGNYDWADPMRSSLLLANNEKLMMADVLKSLDLNAARLVTLSACVTGLTDVRESPDEFIGLATEFLQAGAPAVLSTLWPVDDFSTMLLINRFYEQHFSCRLQLDRALQVAQQWLKELTADQIARLLAEEEEHLFEQGGDDLAFIATQFARFASMPAQSKPFSHPYYWGAFVLSGA